MAHARTFRTAALILRRADMGEADRRLTLLTPTHGKVTAIAKGARKPASRKTGHVELFTRAEVLIARGRSLDILTQAEVTAPYLPLRETLERGAYASYAAELVDKFTVDDVSSTVQLFNLLDATFDRLSHDPDPRRALRYFELHLLDDVGFRPELQVCVVRYEVLQAVDQYFSYEGGGIVSPAGAAQIAGLVEINVRTLKVLRHMQRSPYRDIAQLRIDDPLHDDLERIMLGYISYTLESRLQSVDFIRRVRQLTR